MAADEPGPAGHSAPSSRASSKAVALPTEHGGWGMLAEPLLLGLLLAPSLAAAAIAAASAGAFLCRHPLRLVLADRRKRARYPRTALAERWAALYGLTILVGLALAAWRAGLLPCLPLALAAPLAAVQVVYDARHQGRRLAPELFGSVALASTASAVLLAGGWAWTTALDVWALMAGKAVASIVYVRARLRLDRGQRPALWPVRLTHVLSLTAVCGLATIGRVPWLGALAFTLLLVRALYGLSPFHRPVRPQAVGVQEMAIGFLTTALLALGYALPL